MMMMKFKFNEQRAREFDVNINNCYQVIDRFLAKYKIYPTEKGIYLADIINGFKPFGYLKYYLPETTWFMDLIDEWYWFDDKDHYIDAENYNCLKSIEKWER